MGISELLGMNNIRILVFMGVSGTKFIYGVGGVTKDWLLVLMKFIQIAILVLKTELTSDFLTP